MIFKVKVSPVNYKKRLKNRTKKYTYGSISIKNPALTKYIGEVVLVKISKAGK